MKRTIISIGTSSMLLALTSMALGQTATQERPARGQRGKQTTPPGQTAPDPAAGRQAMDQAQRLGKQIDEMKAAHQSLIDELKALHTMATQEKATETAKQIEALISKRQAAFEESLRPLEQQQLRLQRATRDRTGRPEPRGRQAADFALNSFDGKTVKLADYQGKIVVLEWLNTECPFSRYHHETVQTMTDLAAKYKDKGVVWLGINSTSHTTPEVNRDFAQKQKVTYPILDDRSGMVGRKYGARTTPHMFVIDKDGNIAYDGAIDNAPLGKQEPGSGKLNYVDKALTELLAGQQVSVSTTPSYGCTVKYANP